MKCKNNKIDQCCFSVVDHWGSSQCFPDFVHCSDEQDLILFWNVLFVLFRTPHYENVVEKLDENPPLIWEVLLCEGSREAVDFEARQLWFEYQPYALWQCELVPSRTILCRC